MSNENSDQKPSDEKPLHWYRIGNQPSTSSSQPEKTIHQVYNDFQIQKKLQDYRKLLNEKNKELESIKTQNSSFNFPTPHAPTTPSGASLKPTSTTSVLNYSRVPETFESSKISEQSNMSSDRYFSNTSTYESVKPVTKTPMLKNFKPQIIQTPRVSQSSPPLQMTQFSTTNPISTATTDYLNSLGKEKGSITPSHIQMVDTSSEKEKIPIFPQQPQQPQSQRPQRPDTSQIIFTPLQKNKDKEKQKSKDKTQTANKNKSEKSNLSRKFAESSSSSSSSSASSSQVQVSPLVQMLKKYPWKNFMQNFMQNMMKGCHNNGAN